MKIPKACVICPSLKFVFEKGRWVPKCYFHDIPILEAREKCKKEREKERENFREKYMKRHIKTLLERIHLK